MLQVAYRFDKDGYYFGTCSVQADASGKVLLPSDCTLLEPQKFENAFTKFDGTAWVPEYYPLTCADAIAQNFHCVSNSPDLHQQQCKKIIEDLVASDSENYRTKLDGMVMSIEEITEEAKQTKEDEAAKAELEADIAAIRDDMMTAIAINDNEWFEELRAEYDALVNGEE